jgi:hypothetical protein
LHPAEIVTHGLPLERAGEAYPLIALGKCGKVAVCAEDQRRKGKQPYENESP